MACVSLLSIFLLIYPLIFRPRTRISLYFAFMMISLAIWSITYTLDIAATSYDLMIAINWFMYIGILTLPVFFLSFVLYLTKGYGILEKPFLIILFFPSLIHYLLMVTNDLFNPPIYYLIRVLRTDPPFHRIEIIYGPGFYSNMVYSYILLILAFYFLVRKYLQTPKHETFIRNQLLLIMIGAIIPWIGNFLEIVIIPEIIPVLEFIDLTPVSFSFALIFFAYSIFELGLLDILPIARQLVFEDINDMLLVLDNQLRIIDLNKSSHEFIFNNQSMNKFLHKEFSIIVDELEKQNLRIVHYDEIYQGMESIINGDTDILNQDCDFILFGKKMTRYFYNILATPLKQGNRIVGLILIIRDVSARRRAETILREKTEMQEIILNLLSHDLRNHLHILIGFADIASSSDSTEKINKSLQSIDKKASVILNTVEEVTDYLRIDKLIGTHTQKVNLNDIILEAIEEVKPDITLNKIEIKFHFVQKAFVWSNSIVLKSAILNLLLNAIKFSPRKSIIEINVNEKQKKELWLVSISDQGPGIPEKHHNELFKPFTSIGSKEGTGLGLFIAKSVIESFAGKIWFENNETRGTTFYFTLPKILEGK